MHTDRPLSAHGETRSELRHGGLFDPAHGFAVPCDAQGCVERDRLFIALLDGFRSSGGLLRLSALEAIRRDAWGGDVIDALPARIADGSVLGISWNQETWVPHFQFTGHGATRRPAAAVFLELTPRHDSWDVATWFVTPSAWLQHVRPIDLLEMAPARVLEAARADRYISGGG